MKVKPIDERILIKPLEPENKTASGIIIPDTAKEKPIIGLVIAVGTDEELQKLIKVGDKIVFAKYAGEEITIDGVEHKIIQRSDVLAIIEE
ncbi:MAG: co-chaperone GroES [Ignavibacteria bacterium]|nr:co-chaperone GroES [Ignavibacteria bacterium]